VKAGSFAGSEESRKGANNMSISFTGFFDEMVKIGSVHWTNVDFVDEAEKVAFLRKKKPKDPSYDPDFDPKQSWHKHLKKGTPLSPRMKKDEAYRLNVGIDRIGDKAGDPLKPLRKTAGTTMGALVRRRRERKEREAQMWIDGDPERKKEWEKFEADEKEYENRRRELGLKRPLVLARVTKRRGPKQEFMRKKLEEKKKTAAPMVPFEGDTQTSAKVKPLKKIKDKGRKAGVKKLMKSLGPGEGTNV